MLLILICTLHGLPVGFALAGAMADECQIFLDILNGTETMNQLHEDKFRQLVISDRNYYGAELEDTMAPAGIELLRPARKGEKRLPRARFFGPLGRLSNRSTTPSKGSLTGNGTAAAPRPASSPAWCSGFW
ncbi:hypothetical protein J2T21_003856 [Paeniglutamicibacter psychrophenolicus]|uniref:hypothetical protein n=1 Tax=Paeniglutamicibacter psychrophenolicus TaxID=257454 RepID=UPI00278A7A3B|nr:hypothetical protein [Paeniglutamicibacter psychrophenolicus]MDQ0095942.1 hypothetical protein [Paeniglutamicibacter psychrophenolicus]